MDLVEYLKQPALVANVQQYFGIKLVEKGECKNGNKNAFEITNKFWYYVFVFGTALGDEVFYGCFIPFWFWNVDGFVGRRVVLVWAIVMYIGQAIKDIIRWDRPGPPVVKLQSKWALEYGMPSTHAMVGVSIPFAVVLFTLDRYQYYPIVGFTSAISWCCIVCLSRLYLGMHSVLDIVAGLLLAVLLMVPLVPIVDKLDEYFLTNPTSPFLILFVSILMIVYYPNSGKWTPTRGDTTMIVSVCVGLMIGSWLNYQTNRMSVSELNPPYAIFWPSSVMLLCLILRTILGFIVVYFARPFFTYLCYSFLCALLKMDIDSVKKSKNSLDNKLKNFVELSSKYFMCGVIGFNIVYTMPCVYRMLHIERPTFYTEL